MYIVQHLPGAVDIVSHLWSSSDIAPERRSVCSFVTSRGEVVTWIQWYICTYTLITSEGDPCCRRVWWEGGGAQACVTLDVSHSVYALKLVQTSGTCYTELSWDSWKQFLLEKESNLFRYWQFMLCSSVISPFTPCITCYTAYRRLNFDTIATLQHLLSPPNGWTWWEYGGMSMACLLIMECELFLGAALQAIQRCMRP